MPEGNDVINSIDRALDILLLLQQEGREMGVTQISAVLGIYKSTVHRTLATLENKGFVQQNPDNGKYWLGIRLYSLGMLIRERLPLRNIAYPYAKALAEKFNEVVHVSVNDNTASGYPKHVIIDKAMGQQVLSLTPPIGSSAPSHCAAVGKCLLAFGPRQALQKYIGNPLPVFTEKTIRNWDDLLKELDRIKARGYAVDDEELELGLTCVAAPILGRNAEIIAAVSLSGPTSRVRARFEEIVKELIKTTGTISACLS
ncbi:MAG TPA: IclR family transcriptional regulator [Selenomonadales bacterium]|nr:IclR family transcriptional regulator [Selenomonadales bacterium]